MKTKIHFSFTLIAFFTAFLIFCTHSNAAGTKATKEERRQLYTIFNNNDLSKMTQLIDGGMDINTDMGGGITLLMKAANISTAEMIRLLLDKGADVNATVQNGENALMKAINNSKHYSSIVPLLLDADIDVHVVNSRNGYNPVWQMSPRIKRGFPKEPGVRILTQLLEKGADPNAQFICKNKKLSGMTPLMNASKKGHIHVVKLLLAYGANKDLATAEGQKAIDFAKEKNHQDVVVFLSSFNPSEKDALKKALQTNDVIGPDGKDSILTTCEGNPREPWCYQEAVEKLGDPDLCENILKYWPTAKGVHGWCYYRLAILTQDCDLCRRIKKQDIKRKCNLEVCK